MTTIRTVPVRPGAAAGLGPPDASERRGQARGAVSPGSADPSGCYEHAGIAQTPVSNTPGLCQQLHPPRLAYRVFCSSTVHVLI